MNKKVLLAVLMFFCANVGYADIHPGADAASYVNYTSTYDVDNKALIQNIITTCTEKANEKTKSTYTDFDPERYRSDRDYKVSNSITRVWYNNFLNTLETVGKPKLDSLSEKKQITLEEYAKIASEVRHHARIFTRGHMKDIEMRESDEERDAKKYGCRQGATFEWLLEHQLENQKVAFEKNTGKAFNEKSTEDGGNFDLDKAYRRIIETSTKTNLLVNTFTNACYGWGYGYTDKLDNLCDTIAYYAMPVV